jgi:MFS family permease
LTNKVDQATFTVRDWTEPSVGGLIALGLGLAVVFLFIEARAREPIVPLDLWRNRTYAASIVSTFLVSFGFFGAIIFLPRWFQVVRGESATASGYLIFPLLIGLIGSSIAAGALVARTGRYKMLVIGAIGLMVAGIVLMTQLTADTELPALFLWMFVAGVGIGPTLSVFTIIVQNAVPFSKLGVATSNLTFFRQIGGSVGLAIAGTAFAEGIGREIPRQAGPVFGRIADGAPEPFATQLRQLASLGANGGGAQGIDLSQLTGVGQSFGQAISDFAASMAGPAAEQVRSLFAPFVGQLDHAFFEAFSRAIASTFWIAAAASVAALVAALFMRELRLRDSHGAPSPAAPPPEARPAGTLREAPAVD